MALVGINLGELAGLAKDASLDEVELAAQVRFVNQKNIFSCGGEQKLIFLSRVWSNESGRVR